MISKTNDTATAGLLFLSAQKMGLQPIWLIANNLFTISTPAGERYINHARSTLNTHNTADLAKNKYHTRLILERNNMPNIPFAYPKNMDEANNFIDTHRIVIVKPLKGAGSKDIRIVNNIADINGINLRGYIFEKYIAGKEMRYLVLNDDVIAVHHSEYGESVAVDRPLERNSIVKESWDEDLSKLSLDIARVFCLRFAAIDYMIDPDGRTYILEVNAAPNLKWFHAPSTGPSVDVADMFLSAMVSDIKTVAG